MFFDWKLPAYTRLRLYTLLCMFLYEFHAIYASVNTIFVYFIADSNSFYGETFVYAPIITAKCVATGGYNICVRELL